MKALTFCALSTFNLCKDTNKLDINGIKERFPIVIYSGKPSSHLLSQCKVRLELISSIFLVILHLSGLFERVILYDNERLLYS